MRHPAGAAFSERRACKRAGLKTGGLPAPRPAQGFLHILNTTLHHLSNIASWLPRLSREMSAFFSRRRVPWLKNLSTIRRQTGMPARQRAPGSFEKTSAPHAASSTALARIFERLSIPSPAASFYGAYANFASRPDAFQGAPSWFYELSNPAAALHRQTTILVSPSCALVCFEKLSASHAAFPAAFIRTSSVVLTPSKACHRGLFRKTSIPPTFPFHNIRADFSCCPCHLQKRAIVVLRIKKTCRTALPNWQCSQGQATRLIHFEKLSAPPPASPTAFTRASPINPDGLPKCARRGF